MTGPNRNLGVSEPWGRATEKEIEELKDRIRKLEGGRKIVAKGQSVLADLVAKAEVQDQLLQDRLNFQDVVTYSTEPPFSNDTAEEDPNDGIGETFPLPDPSEPTNPNNPGGDSSDSDFPAPNPEDTVPEPEYRWIQEDPLRGVIEGEWTLVDGVWEPRQVGSDYVADGAIIRDKIEQAVLDDIDEANSNANEAVIAANGKNTIYRGPNSPTPPSNGFNEGDTWFDTSGGDTTIKTWTGSAWNVQEVGTESLAVGAITAESGIIASLDAGVISTGTLNADRIDSRSITADKLLIASGANLLQDTSFELWYWNQGTTPVIEAPISGPGGSPAIMALAGTSIRYSGYYAGSTTFSQDKDLRIPVNGEEEFVASAWVYSPTAIAAGSITLGQVRYTETGTRTMPLTTYGEPIPAATWTKIEVDWKTNSGTRYLGMYLQVRSSHSDEVYFSLPSVERKVGGTLIEDGAVTTGKIAANAIEADHIKANAITAPKIGAGAVTARTLNVIAEEDNRRLSILPDGIRLWGDTDSGGDPNISLTTSGADYFSITSNGATVAGMDNEGTVIGNVISAAERLEVEGQDILDIINEGPRGVVARYTQDIRGRTTTSASGGLYGRLAFMEIVYDHGANRVYELSTENINVNLTSGTWAIFRAWWTTDGSKPTFTHYDGVRTLSIVQHRDGSIQNHSMSGRMLFTGSTDRTIRILLGLQIEGSNGKVTIHHNENGGDLRAHIIDHGAHAFEESGGNRTEKESHDAPPSGGGDPAPKKTYTNTWTANNSASYTGSGSVYSYAGRNVYQGYWLAANGNLRGLWTFPSSVWSATNGSEVIKVELYVKNSHARWNAGLTAYFGTHARSTVANPGTTRSNGWTTKFAKGEGKWITLSGSAFNYFKTRLQGGNPVGMMIYTTGSDNYGYFDGSAKIRVTYKK